MSRVQRHAAKGQTGTEIAEVAERSLQFVWEQMSYETRRMHLEMAVQRNAWNLTLEEQGARETWERNPFRKQMQELNDEEIIETAQTAEFIIDKLNASVLGGDQCAKTKKEFAEEIDMAAINMKVGHLENLDEELDDKLD